MTFCSATTPTRVREGKNLCFFVCDRESEQFYMGNRKRSTSSSGSGHRRKKRRYYAPKQSSSVPVVEEGTVEAAQSASSRKISSRPKWLSDMVMEFESELVCSSDSDSDESSSDSCQEYDDDAFYPDVEESVSGYKIVDLQCLQELMDQFTVCRKCTKGDMIVSNCHDTGLGSTLRLQCALCGHSGSTSLSKKICRSYDLN